MTVTGQELVGHRAEPPFAVAKRQFQRHRGWLTDTRLLRQVGERPAPHFPGHADAVTDGWHAHCARAVRWLASRNEFSASSRSPAFQERTEWRLRGDFSHRWRAMAVCL